MVVTYQPHISHTSATIRSDIEDASTTCRAHGKHMAITLPRDATHRIDHLVAMREQQHPRLIWHRAQELLTVLTEQRVRRLIARSPVGRGMVHHNDDAHQRQDARPHHCSSDAEQDVACAEGIPHRAQEMCLWPEALLHLPREWEAAVGCGGQEHRRVCTCEAWRGGRVGVRLGCAVG